MTQAIAYMVKEITKEPEVHGDANDQLTLDKVVTMWEEGRNIHQICKETKLSRYYVLKHLKHVGLR